MRFDGITLVPFARKLTDQLHAAIGDFWSVGFDGGGRLWVQGGGSVARLDTSPRSVGTSRDEHWTIYWLPGAPIMGMTFMADGRTVCIGEGTAQVFNGTGFTAIAATEADASNSEGAGAPWLYGQADRRSGTLWLWAGGGHPGMFRFASPFHQGVPREERSVTGVTQLPVVSVGLGATGTWALLADGVAVHRGETWERCPLRLPGDGTIVSGKIAEATDGTLWISTHESLIACGRDRIEATVGGLPGFSFFTHALLADDTGGMWAACSGGLLTARRKPVSIDPVARCTAVFERSDGSLLVGRPESVERRSYDASGTLVAREQVAALPPNAVPTAILETPEGRVWVGTQDAFLLRVDDGVVTPVAKPASESFRMMRSVQAIALDAEGRVWAGTSNGLAAYDSEHDMFTMAPSHGATSPVRIIGLAADPDGGLLVAASGRGVTRLFPDGRIERLMDHKTMPGRQAIVFHRDSRHALWVGGDLGLVRVTADGAIQRIGSDHGLVGETVRQIEEDRHGRLWVAMREGRLQGMRLVDLDALAMGRVSMVRGTVLHAVHGLGDAECLGRITRLIPFAPDSTRRPAGAASLIVPLDEGILRYDPPDHESSPVTRDSPVVSADVLDGGRTVRFHYRSPGMHLDGPPTYQTSLHGVESGWSPPDAEGVREYRGLLPGRYTFAVRRVEGETEGLFPQSAIDIEVPVPWWRRPWSVATAIVVLVAAATSLSRWIATARTRRAIFELERQRERERDRARIARDIHDSLGAGLTRIALMSENARRGRHSAEELDHRLDALYRDAHGLARTVDEIVWAVNPLHDTLAGFLSYSMQEVEDCAHAADLQLRFDVPDDLPALPLDAAARHHLCLAVREAVQNTLRHSGCTTLGYGIRVVGANIQVTVEDDGCGFDPHARKADGQDGLHNIRGRVAELGGSVEIDSSPGQGTRVTLTLPLTPSRTLLLPSASPHEERRHAVR